ncbi:MAG: hypothetical protein AB7I27_10380 [Bacteriovoracaceae bacterium]
MLKFILLFTLILSLNAFADSDSPLFNKQLVKIGDCELVRNPLKTDDLQRYSLKLTYSIETIEANGPKIERVVNYQIPSIQGKAIESLSKSTASEEHTIMFFPKDQKSSLKTCLDSKAYLEKRFMPQIESNDCSGVVSDFDRVSGKNLPSSSSRPSSKSKARHQ